MQKRQREKGELSIEGTNGKNIKTIDTNNSLKPPIKRQGGILSLDENSKVNYMIPTRNPL